MYNQLADPLRKILEVASKTAASAKKTALAKISLTLIGWSDDHLNCFENVKRALAEVAPLSHPRSDMAVCLCTDASDQFWGAAVPNEDLDLPLEEQRHEPLAF
jgi:hypothetical protein